MKRRNILLTGLALALLQFSCTDFNEQFEGLDDMVTPKNIVSYDYELTADDYSAISKSALADAQTAEDTAMAESIAENMYFTETVSAANYVPYLLETMYPYSDLGSSAMVTYAYGADKPEYFSELRTINILNAADYQLAWGSETEYFELLTPSISPEEKLPVILAANFPSANSGEYKFVEYEYVDDPNPTGAIYIDEDWTSNTVSEGGWMTINVEGSINWVNKSYGGNTYAQASSYNSGEINQAYLISPEIDFSNAVGPKLTFDVAVGYYNATCLSVWVSENFDGDVSTATWTELNGFSYPEQTSGYSAMTNAGSADLSAFEGKTIHIAFRYDGDGRSAADRGDDPAQTTTYQVDNILVSSLPTGDKKYAIYSYNGTKWQPANTDTFYALQIEDYESMGRSYLYSSIVPSYITNFLLNKFPYAMEGDVKTVVYKSGSNPTYSGAVQYTFNGEEWINEDFIDNKTEQFLVSNDGWVFDPTVVYTMTKPDYQLVVDYVRDNISADYLDSYKTAEFYYGFASYYGNVSLRLNYRDSYLEYDTELGALDLLH